MNYQYSPPCQNCLTGTIYMTTCYASQEYLKLNSELSENGGGGGGGGEAEQNLDTNNMWTDSFCIYDTTSINVFLYYLVSKQ